MNRRVFEEIKRNLINMKADKETSERVSILK